MIDEIWKPIPEFDGYEASNLGRIRTLKRLKTIRNIKKQGTNIDGYRTVNLCKNGKKYIITVHRLVALAFIGPCPNGLEVCHNDGSRDNNYISNLRYDTHKNNVREGLLATNNGKTSDSHKEENDRANKKREFYNQIRLDHHQNHLTRYQLSRKYNIKYKTICNILHKRKSRAKNYHFDCSSTVINSIE